VTDKLTADEYRLASALERTPVGATLGHVACQNCKEPVAVKCGDVTGMTLDGMIAQALQRAIDQCPAHEPVKVGT
jgi:hypothetical protein